MSVEDLLKSMVSKSRNKCRTPRCRNKVPQGRSICHTCDSRNKRARNPTRAVYEALRFNARRRGKEFSLTFEYFKEWAVQERLLKPDGTRYPNKTVDRKQQHLGYVEGNLQVLTLSENSRKRYVDYWAQFYGEMSEEELNYYKEKEARLQAEIEQRRIDEEELPF